MTKSIFIAAVLMSLNSFASLQCVNLSGTYILGKGDCQEYPGKSSELGGIPNQEFVAGTEALNVYEGTMIQIEQRDCESFRLTIPSGKLDENQKAQAVVYNYNGDGLTNFFTARANSITVKSAYALVGVNEAEDMTLTKSNKGMIVDYTGRLLTLAFVIPTTYTSKSRCEFTRIQE